MSTISLTMIVRNAADNLEACLESVKGHVDEMIIVLAGESTDATPAIARKYTDQVYDFEWIEDFAAARNFALSKATGDWVFWIDADDVVVGAEKLREVVADCEQRAIGCIHLHYHYRHDEHGNPTVTQERERLLRRDLEWEWVDRVHEFARAKKEHYVAISDDVLIRHTNNHANTERNLRLLSIMALEKPNYPRAFGALGDTYQSQGQFEKAIGYWEQYAQVAEIPVLRWQAMTELSRCYQKLGDWSASRSWALNALALEPDYALPCLLLAHAAWFGSHNSQEALRWIADAETRDPAPLQAHRLPFDYTVHRWNVEHRAYADLAAASNDLESWTRAYTIVLHALEALPQDETWNYFGWYYQERINCERSLLGLQQVADHFCMRGDTLHALKLVEECCPVSLREDGRYLALLNRLRQLTAHVRDYDGKYEQFYEDMHSGVGGVVHMLNATVPEPWRLDPIIARLKKAGVKRILDVGCGAGAPSIYLAQKGGFFVQGIDINAEAIKEARRSARKALGTMKRNGAKALLCEFSVGSFDDLGPEQLGKFDAVLMMELIEHLPPDKVPFYLSSAEDCLATGGIVLFTTPGMLCGDLGRVWDENRPRDHVWEFSYDDLALMVMRAPGARRRREPLSLHKLYDRTAHAPGFACWLAEYRIWHDQPERQPDDPWLQPVSIYVGPGLEPWTPESPDEVGLGGSETWAIKTARELRAEGHPVIVYGMASGIWDGVIHQPWQNFRYETPFGGQPAWLTIISRYIEMLDQRPASDQVFFIAHDVDYSSEFSEARATNTDAVLCLSEWHRDHLLSLYPFLESGVASVSQKVPLYITANGIEPSFFEEEHFAPIERSPRSFIWSSSPDRGLDRLLEWWPRIVQLWPDATLDIFYGWENIDALAPQGRPWLLDFKAKIVALLKQPGVTWRGRVGQRELAHEFRQHQFWLYPSVNAFGEPWHETFCITAWEAQAGGCYPIVPDCGALPERIAWGKVTPSEMMTLDEALEALMLFDPGTRPAADIDPESWSWRTATKRLLALTSERDPVLAAMGA